MKLGLIRCKETENFCPGTRDFQTIKEKSGALSYVKEDIEIIGFIDCGGCPGKVAILRARELVKRGADTIAFTSCIGKGTPIGYPCPFAKKMKELLKLIFLCLKHQVLLWGRRKQRYLQWENILKKCLVLWITSMLIMNLSRQKE